MWFNRFFGRRNKEVRSTSPTSPQRFMGRRPGARQLQLEPLEQRRLLSLTNVVDFNPNGAVGGALDASGGPFPDQESAWAGYEQDGEQGDAQSVIAGVPAYDWYRGCGPTAAGMVVGYWDMNGFPNLITGDSSTQTTDVNSAIASAEHWNDYSLPLDDTGTGILADKSTLGGAHASNSIGDWMQTSWSATNNYYGWSRYTHVDDAIDDYANSRGYAGFTTRNETWGAFTWTDYVTEIDSGRPMVFLVDTNGDGDTDHFVTAIGYDNLLGRYACYNTWNDSVHWYDFAGKAVGQLWGIHGATFVEPPIPQVNLSVEATTGTEAGRTEITVTATATAAVGGDQTVDLGVSGTGITAADYDLSDAQITIPDGNTSGSVTFTVKDDLLNEGNETATLTMSNPSGGIALGATTSRDVVIEDDDNGGTLNFTLPASGNFTLIRNGSAVEVRDSGGGLLASSSTGEPIAIHGTAGDDTITVDYTGGFFSVPTTVHGGSDAGGGDMLRLVGNLGGGANEAYSPGGSGPDGFSGTMAVTNGATHTVNFTGMEPVEDLVVLASLTVNDTAAIDTMNFVPGPLSTANDPLTGVPEPTYQVNFAGGAEAINFRNKTWVMVDGLAGNNTITLNQASHLGDSLAGIGLDASGGDDTANILATPAGVQTNVDLDGGTQNTVVVGATSAIAGLGLGSLVPIQGSIWVVNPTTHNLIVDNSGGVVDQNWMVDSPGFWWGQVTATGLSAGIVYDTDWVPNVTIYAGSGDDQLTVDFTGGLSSDPMPATGLTFNGGAENLGDSMLLQNGTFTTVTHTFNNANDGTITSSGFLGTLTYNGLEPITDNLNVTNRVFTFASAVANATLTNVSGTQTRIDSNVSELVDFTTPSNSLTVILANGTNTLSVNSLAGDYNTPTNTIWGNNGVDTVNFEALGNAGSPTWIVEGGLASDVVHVSPIAQDLDLLLGSVDFRGGSATDTLNVNDDFGGFGDSFTVTSTQILRPFAPSFSGATYDANVEVVNLDTTGGGGDTINVLSTSATATTMIDAGTGDDTFVVGQAGTLSGILGPLDLRGDAGTNDQVTFDDSAEAGGESYTITSTTFQRTGTPATALVTYGGMEGLTLNAGTGGDFVDVVSTAAGAPVTVNAGTGNDTVSVTWSSGNLDSLAAPLTINGDGGTADSVTFWDDLNGATRNYTLSDSSLAFNPTAGSSPVVMSGLELATLRANGAADNIDVIPSASTEFSVYGNAPAFYVPGGDTLDYQSLGNATLNITGPGSGIISQGGLKYVNFYSIETVTNSAGGLFNLVVNASAGSPASMPNDSSADSFIVTLDPTGTDVQISVGPAGSETLVYQGALSTISSIQVMGSGDDDTLTVLHDNGMISAPGGIFFNGEAFGGNTGLGDLLVSEGSPAVQILRETSYSFGPDSGVLYYDPDDSAGPGASGPFSGDEETIIYTNLTPVFDTTAAVQTDFFATSGADLINVIDGPISPMGFQTLEISEATGPTFETQWFANKGTLTVNSLDGADSFWIDYTNPVISAIGTLELYGNELTGGAINIDDGAPEWFDLRNTSAAIPTLNLYGQGGVDTISNLTVFTLDGVLGSVNIFGGASQDLVELMDPASLDPTGKQVTLTSNSLTGATGIDGSGGPITYTGVEAMIYEGTAVGDIIDVLSTNLGTDYIVSGDGGGDTFTVGASAATFNTGAGTLDLVQGHLTIWPDFNNPGGVDTLNVDDSATPSLDAVPASITNNGLTVPPFSIFGSMASQTTRLSGFAPADIDYAHLDIGGSVSSRLEYLNVIASTGGDTINVNDTTATINTMVDAYTGNDAATMTINGDGLSANNLFLGNTGTDRFVLNVSVDLGNSAVFPLTSLEIRGDMPSTSSTRDSLEIYDNSAKGRDLIFDYLDTAGAVDIRPGTPNLGLGGAVANIPVNVRTMETLAYQGTGIGDAVEIQGTTGTDDLTVAPLNSNSALVFLDGNPWDGPSDLTPYASAYPGMAGGGAGPDMRINGVVATGINMDGGGGIDDQVYVYAPDENPLTDFAGTTIDPFNPSGLSGMGFGLSVLIPGFGFNTSYDDITVDDTTVAIDNRSGIGVLLPVNLDTPDFVQTTDPAAPGLFVNTGNEATPPMPLTPVNDIADDVTAVLSYNFALQINGLDPAPSYAPDGRSIERDHAGRDQHLQRQVDPTGGQDYVDQSVDRIDIVPAGLEFFRERGADTGPDQPAGEYLRRQQQSGDRPERQLRDCRPGCGFDAALTRHIGNQLGLQSAGSSGESRL